LEVRGLVGGLQIRALRREQFDHRRPVRCRRVHQRRLAANTVFRVHVGAVLDQHAHRVHFTRGRRHHQGRRAVWRAGLHIAAGLDEGLDHLAVSLLAGEIERCIRPQPRRRPNIRAGEDQHLRELEIAIHRRPVQRRHAVALRRIDVGALLQQCLDGDRIARLCSIRNAGPRTLERDRNYQQSRHQQSAIDQQSET